MGIHVIKMPDLGEGIAEVEVVAWRVQPGDAVVEDQVLADVMTDKATVEIPSPVHGTVLALGGALGEALAVGAELIRLEVEGSGNAMPGKAHAATPVKATAAAAVAAAPEPKAPLQAKAAPAAPAPSLASRAAGEKPLAPPAVRQRAWDLGIDLQYVFGSGPAGRITHADLDAYVARGQAGGARGTGGGERYARLQGETRCRSSACAARSPKRCRTPSAAFRTSRTWKKSTSPKSTRCAQSSTRALPNAGA
jgi:2-oxoisovalerate dehydrogenase E2 component (dihydrolipoyl transacylase)